jgi:hypothetical protein
MVFIIEKVKALFMYATTKMQLETRNGDLEKGKRTTHIRKLFKI